MNRHDLQNPSLIVSWDQDVGLLGETVVNSLKQKLGLEFIGEIEPTGFFPLDAVAVRENVIQFPLSRFYSSPVSNLFVFESHAPSREPYEFLSRVLDFAIDHCAIKEIYTIGGVVTSTVHISPRRVFGIVNRPEFKEILARCNVQTGIDYQTPPGGGTSLSNFLLWETQRRNLASCTLWTEVPFYLASVHDPMASKGMLAVLDTRFELGLDFSKIDMEIHKLNSQIQALRAQNPDISRYLGMLERGIMLSDDEGRMLASEVAKFLRQRG